MKNRTNDAPASHSRRTFITGSTAAAFLAACGILPTGKEETPAIGGKKIGTPNIPNNTQEIPS